MFYYHHGIIDTNLVPRSSLQPCKCVHITHLNWKVSVFSYQVAVTLQWLSRARRIPMCRVSVSIPNSTTIFLAKFLDTFLTNPRYPFPRQYDFKFLYYNNYIVLFRYGSSETHLSTTKHPVWDLSRIGENYLGISEFIGIRLIRKKTQVQSYNMRMMQVQKWFLNSDSYNPTKPSLWRNEY